MRLASLSPSHLKLALRDYATGLDMVTFSCLVWVYSCHFQRSGSPIACEIQIILLDPAFDCIVLTLSRSSLFYFLFCSFARQKLPPGYTAISSLSASTVSVTSALEENLWPLDSFVQIDLALVCTPLVSVSSSGMARHA